MRKTEEKAIVQNGLIDDTNEDMIGRKSLIDKMLLLVECLPKNKHNSFALNGKWGSGKSWVLNKFENKVRENNIVIHYNAWENDFYEEPIIAILSSFADELNKLLNTQNTFNAVKKAVLKSACNIFLDVINKIIKFRTGLDIKSVSKKISEKINESNKEESLNNDFDDKLVLKSSIQSITKAISFLSETNTVIIIVDELDRCLPEYSIKVLERLHHIFENTKNTISILSVDKNQLNRTVREIFGEKVEVAEYLQKFIQFEIPVEIGVLNENFEKKYNELLMFFDNKTSISKEIIDYFIQNIFADIDMRTRLNLIDKAILIQSSFFKDTKNDYTVMLFELLWLTLNYQYKINNYSQHNNINHTNPLKTYNSQIIIEKTGLNEFLKKIWANYRVVNYNFANIQERIPVADLGDIYQTTFLYFCSMENNLELHASSMVIELMQQNIKTIRVFKSITEFII